jgi:DNA-directed RNA polymerase specialized sigma24 family protein
MDDDRALPFLRAALVKLARSRRGRRTATPRPRRPKTAATHLTRHDARYGPEHDRLVAALSRLPERQRTAIVLHDYVRLSDEEIASTMGCRVRAARSHRRRATTALSTALGADR